MNTENLLIDKYIEFEGQKVFYRISKHGKNWIMLFQPIGLTSAIVEEFALALNNIGYGIIIWDYPGHGKSSQIDNIALFSSENFSLVSSKILEKEMIRTIVPLGFCIGNNVAIRLKKYVKVNKMVLVNAYDIPKQNVKPWGKLSRFLAKILNAIITIKRKLKITRKELKSIKYQKLTKLNFYYYIIKGSNFSAFYNINDKLPAEDIDFNNTLFFYPDKDDIFNYKHNTFINKIKHLEMFTSDHLIDIPESKFRIYIPKIITFLKK